MREMKDSGVEWIGRIPQNWTISRLKDFCNFQTGSTPPLSDGINVDENGIRWYTPKELVEGSISPLEAKMYISFEAIQKYKVHIYPVSSILFVGIASIGKLACISQEAYSNQQITAIKLCENLPKYVTYFLLAAEDFIKEDALYTTVPIINNAYLGTVRTLIPPIYEQQTIAKYLDRKCAEIDALTSDIETQVETLEQYKRSVITEAVTKGLDPDAEMKDSGVEWIGRIPMAWETIKIKYLTCTRNVSRAFDPEVDNYIGLENVQSYKNNILSSVSQYEASIQKVCCKGDVMFGKLRPYLAKVIIAPFNGFCTGEFLQFSHFEGDKRFLRYFMLSDGFIEHVNASTYGAKMPRANTEFIINSLMTYPAMAEQKHICNYLDSKCSEIDDIIAVKHTQLETLTEYKKSVIYEYVTGKKEVPNA